MRLPNGERALVDIRKLRDYCLSATHPRGRHKARVFAAATGLGPRQALLLWQGLMKAAIESPATLSRKDEYGQRYVVECTVSGPRGEARVRSVWIVPRGQDRPRFLTCYVL